MQGGDHRGLCGVLLPEPVDRPCNSLPCLAILRHLDPIICGESIVERLLRVAPVTAPKNAVNAFGLCKFDLDPATVALVGYPAEVVPVLSVVQVFCLMLRVRSVCIRAGHGQIRPVFRKRHVSGLGLRGENFDFINAGFRFAGRRRVHREFDEPRLGGLENLLVGRAAHRRPQAWRLGSGLPFRCLFKRDDIRRKRAACRAAAEQDGAFVRHAVQAGSRLEAAPTPLLGDRR